MIGNVSQSKGVSDAAETKENTKPNISQVGGDKGLAPQEPVDGPKKQLNRYNIQLIAKSADGKLLNCLTLGPGNLPSEEDLQNDCWCDAQEIKIADANTEEEAAAAFKLAKIIIQKRYAAGKTSALDLRSVTYCPEANFFSGLKGLTKLDASLSLGMRKAHIESLLSSVGDELETLNLQSCVGLNPEDFTLLSQFKRLKYINLSTTKIDRSGLNALADNLGQTLEVLSLSGNSLLKPEDFSILEKFTHLKGAELANKKINGLGLRSLAIGSGQTLEWIDLNDEKQVIKEDHILREATYWTSDLGEDEYNRTLQHLKNLKSLGTLDPKNLPQKDELKKYGWLEVSKIKIKSPATEEEANAAFEIAKEIIKIRNEAGKTSSLDLRSLEIFPAAELFSNLDGLVELDAADSSIDEPHLKNLAENVGDKLQTLSVSHCKKLIGTDFQCLKKFTCLKKVNLSYSPIGSAKVQGMIHLLWTCWHTNRKLYESTTEEERKNYIADLEAERKVSGLAPLAEGSGKTLEWLSIDGCKELTESDLCALESFTNLKHADLSRTNIAVKRLNEYNDLEEYIEEDRQTYSKASEDWYAGRKKELEASIEDPSELETQLSILDKALAERHKQNEDGIQGRLEKLEAKKKKLREESSLYALAKGSGETLTWLSLEGCKTLKPSDFKLIEHFTSIEYLNAAGTELDKATALALMTAAKSEIQVQIGGGLTRILGKK